MAANSHRVAEARTSNLKNYWPLVALILTSALVAVALYIGGFGQGRGGMILPGYKRTLMHAFMGTLLVIFALLKIFDLRGFAEGFSRYDLVGRAVGRWWNYVYPFVELALGLAFLAFFEPGATYIVTAVIFAVGALGVLLGLRRGLDMACPCMGNILRVPLSTVTLVEDVLMAAMAAMMAI